MDDRELLELAAKAAGMALYPGDAWRDTATGVGLLLSNGRWIWNPLHHDGDALRLAVKIRINIEHFSVYRQPTHKGVSCSAILNGTPVVKTDYAKDGHDDNATVRRAIVLTAAEIGRRMPCPPHKTPQEVADEKRERDDEAYADMYAKVREEMQRECDFVSPRGVDVHNETMKRLREKNLR